MLCPKRLCIVVLTLAICLCIPSFSRADAVTDWNAISLQTIVNAPCPAAPCANPPVHPGATSLLDTAMVQAAVYDAVESITGRFRPYAVHVQGASGSTAAVVAKAAHDVLVNRFPFPTLVASLDETYHNYLVTHSLAEDDPGVGIGAQAAAGTIALRANDGSFPSPPPPNIIRSAAVSLCEHRVALFPPRSANVRLAGIEHANRSS